MSLLRENAKVDNSAHEYSYLEFGNGMAQRSGLFQYNNYFSDQMEWLKGNV